MKIPNPIVINNINVAPSSDVNTNNNPTISVFVKVGIKGDKNGIPLNFISLTILVPIAPVKVAIVPHIQSIAPSGLAKLDKKQPNAKPGIAALVNTGKIVSISDILNCIPPYAKPKAADI